MTGAQHVVASPQACCRTSSASEDLPAPEASSNGHAPSGPAANGLPLAERAEATLLYVRFRAAAEPGLRGAHLSLLSLHREVEPLLFEPLLLSHSLIMRMAANTQQAMVGPV